MTPADEHRLYLKDRPAWAAYIAPNWLRILTQSDEAERKRTWAMACPELKTAIRRLVQEAS